MLNHYRLPAAGSDFVQGQQTLLIHVAQPGRAVGQSNDFRTRYLILDGEFYQPHHCVVCRRHLMTKHLLKGIRALRENLRKWAIKNIVLVGNPIVDILNHFYYSQKEKYAGPDSSGGRDVNRRQGRRLRRRPARFVRHAKEWATIAHYGKSCKP